MAKRTRSANKITDKRFKVVHCKNDGFGLNNFTQGVGEIRFIFGFTKNNAKLYFHFCINLTFTFFYNSPEPSHYTNA